MIVAQKNHHTKFFQPSAPENVPPGRKFNDLPLLYVSLIITLIALGFCGSLQELLLTTKSVIHGTMTSIYVHMLE